MGRFAQRVERMQLNAVSSDGRIAARLSSGSRLEFAFSRGAYDRYDTGELGTQLSELLGDLFAENRKARSEALSKTLFEISGRTTEPVDPRSLDRREREFYERRQSLESHGASAHDLIRVNRTGRDDWKVRIRPGTLDRIDEDGFKRELGGAVASVEDDHRRNVFLLHSEIYSDVTRAT